MWSRNFGIQFFYCHLSRILLIIEQFITLCFESSCSLLWQHNILWWFLCLHTSETCIQLFNYRNTQFSFSLSLTPISFFFLPVPPSSYSSSSYFLFRLLFFFLTSLSFFFLFLNSFSFPFEIFFADWSFSVLLTGLFLVFGSG